MRAASDSCARVLPCRASKYSVKTCKTAGQRRVSPLGLADDSTAFCKGEVTIRDDRRHPHKVGILQILRSTVFSIPLVSMDLVWNFELFLG